MKRRKKTGRPTKCTPGRLKAICEGVRLGMSIAGLAAAAEIDVQTLYNWKRWGEADIEEGRQTPYSMFFEAFARAHADFERNLVANIQRSAKGAVIEVRTTTKPDGSTETVERRSAPDWRAAAHMLACRMPEEWAQRQRIEHTGKDGAPITVSAQAVRSLPDEDLEAAERALSHLVETAQIEDHAHEGDPDEDEE